MTGNIKYVVAVTALIAGLVVSNYATAGCGSCGPAAAPEVKAAPDCTKSQCEKAKACPMAKKGCPTKSVGECPAGACGSKVADTKGCPAGCTKPCCAAKKGCTKGKGCTKTGCSKSAKESAVIGTHVLEALIAAGSPVTILDARSGKWDDGRRVPGAKSLAPDSTAEQAAAVIPSKDALVVTYCSSTKCGASAKLAMTLKNLGYSNILEYSAGIDGWASHGNPVK